MRKWLCSLVIGALLVAPAGANDEPKAPPEGKRSSGAGTSGPGGQLRIAGRLYVGDPAPDFELPSSRDRKIVLSRQRGDWLLLVFVADRNDFAAMRTINDDCAAIGVRLFGVCRDNPQSLRSAAAKDGIPFEMLADPTGEISSMYGFYDALHRTCVPAFVVLDRRGVVKLVVSGQVVPPTQILELTRVTVEGG